MITKKKMNLVEFLSMIGSSEDRTFVSEDGTVSIVLKKAWWSTFVQLEHRPWKCPSSYNDSDPHKNSGRVCDYACELLPASKWHVRCESDDYAEIPYLYFYLQDEDTLVAVDDSRAQFVLRRK